MEKVVLKAAKRSLTGKRVKQLRQEGQLPAVIYGHHVETTPIALDAHEANLTIPHLTSSSVVTIDLDGKEIPALVRERQKNYIKGYLIHVDFQAVSLTEKIRAMVSLHQHGLAPAVKDFSAALVTNMDSIEVEALPQDLPERLEIDLSVLAEIGSAIHVRDLALPESVTVLSDLDEIIVVATATREEVVEEAEEATAEGEEPEVIERGRKEEGEESASE